MFSLSRTWAGRRALLGLLVFFLPLVSLVGCASKKSRAVNQAVVTGKVTFNKAPVTGGVLTLYPAANPLAFYSVPVLPDGTFQATDLPPGKVLVTVDTLPVKNKPVPPPLPSGAPSAQPDTTDLGTYVAIPARYANKDTSGITWDIQAGTQTHDVTLTP